MQPSKIKLERGHPCPPDFWAGKDTPAGDARAPISFDLFCSATYQRFMILRILILIVALTASGCDYLYSKDSKDKFDRQDLWQTENNGDQVCAVSAENLRIVFNFEGIDSSTYKPEEDPDLLIVKRLKECPPAETAEQLVALQNGDPNDLGTKAKATYLLVKIGHQVPENAALLLDLYAKRWNELTNRHKEKDFEEKSKNKSYDNRYTETELIRLIGGVLAADYRDEKFIAKVLDLETDGALSDDLSGICAAEFAKDPEGFLRIVRTKPKLRQKTLLHFTAYTMRPEKITEAIATIPKSSDVYPLTKELIKAGDKIAGK
jgi:hypothetical protein